MRRTPIRSAPRESGDGWPTQANQMRPPKSAWKKRKEKQLRLLRDFFIRPEIVQMQNDSIPTSSSTDEIEQRKRELHYRLNLIKALLEVTESELQLLSEREKTESNIAET